MKNVLILGAGFAGLELATRLSEDVPDEVDVTIIDSSDAFVFGFSKLDLMFGRAELDAVRIPYARLDKPSVRFAREAILAIDPESRRVVTDAATYEADILVVALSADLDPGATPGVLEEGTEYYSVEGANRVRSVLPTFNGGEVIVGVLGPFFKCPAAPFETAIMLHDYLEKRDLRAASKIKLVSPMPKPIPISDEASDKGRYSNSSNSESPHLVALKEQLMDPEFVQILELLLADVTLARSRNERSSFGACSPGSARGEATPIAYELAGEAGIGRGAGC